MLLSFSLLLLLCESTVKSQTTPPTTVPSTVPHYLTTGAAGEKLSLQLVATPDYPVAAGQRVNLHCNTFTMPGSVTLSWQRLENLTWLALETRGDLTLTKPEESGLYRCRAESQLSQNHTVYIVSVHTTVSAYLGIAAFVLSLLALIINFTILFWLGYHRLNATFTTSNIAAQGFPGPEKSPKGGLPHTESDGGVYINYTNTSQDYTDLDPTHVTEESLYSSLS